MLFHNNIHIMKKRSQSRPEWCPLKWSLGSCPTMWKLVCVDDYRCKKLEKQLR
jgi:hypothetical protein